MLQKEIETQPELTFYNKKEFDFFKKNPVSVQSLNEEEKQHIGNFKKSLNKILAVGALGLGSSFIVNLMITGPLLQFFMPMLMAFFVFLMFCVFLFEFFLIPRIVSETGITVSFEKHEKCKAYANYSGMEDVKQYISKVEILGRRLSHKEHHEVMLVWNKFLKTKKNINFLKSEN